MIKLLLGLAQPPSPYDAADALAVAICHVHSGLFKAGLKTRLSQESIGAAGPQTRLPRSWRQYRPPAHG
jgi:hypothetical protein